MIVNRAANTGGLQYLEKDKTRAATPRVMQEKGQLQGGLRYLGQLFRQLQVSLAACTLGILASASAWC